MCRAFALWRQNLHFNPHPLIISKNACVYRCFEMRGLRRKSLIAPTQAPHIVPHELFVEALTSHCDDSKNWRRLVGMNEGLMRDFSRKSLILKRFVDRHFRRKWGAEGVCTIWCLKADVGCPMYEYSQIGAKKFSRGADFWKILNEYCAILVEYFTKVIEIAAYLHEIELYLMEMDIMFLGDRIVTHGDRNKTFLTFDKRKCFLLFSLNRNFRTFVATNKNWRCISLELLLQSVRFWP